MQTRISGFSGFSSISSDEAGARQVSFGVAGRAGQVDQNQLGCIQALGQIGRFVRIVWLHHSTQPSQFQ